MSGNPKAAEMKRHAIRWTGLAAASLLCGAALAEPSAMILRDSFDGPDFSPAGGLYYRENFEQSAGKVEFQKAVKLRGDGALKLSVKPLCTVEDDGCSERAEIWERTELRVPYDQGVWYGFAVKFADPVPTDDHRYLIAQWKREIDPGAEGDFSPFLALQGAQRQAVCDGRDQLYRAGRQGHGCRRRGLQGRRRPRLVQARDQPDAGAGRDRRGLGSSRQRPLSRLHQGDHRHRPRQQAAVCLRQAGSTLRSTPSRGRPAPAISRSSPTASRSSRSRAISAMPTRALARTSISNSVHTGPVTQMIGRSTMMISGARRAAPM